jgi:hypothetical protein
VESSVEKETKMKPSLEPIIPSRNFSWFDDKSRDSFLVIEDGEDIGRERVRSWRLERRADEMGWDGSI